MKKILKILFVNLVLFVFVLLIINICAYTYLVTTSRTTHISMYRPLLGGFAFEDDDYKDSAYINDFSYLSPFRPVENLNSDKRPIVLFGCSFIYGLMLLDNQTFSYYLGQATKRPVYNRGKIGWSPREMAYQLKNDKFYKILPKDKNNKPEYVIYTLIADHISRILSNRDVAYSDYAIFYKLNKRKSENDDYIIRDRFKEILSGNSVVNIISNYIFDIKRYKFKDEDIELLKGYFRDCKKEVNKHYGNSTKFVILLYDYDSLLKEVKDKFKDLEEEGFIILDASEVAGVNLYTTEYQLNENDPHPNEKAWIILAPKLAEKLGMNN